MKKRKMTNDKKKKRWEPHGPFDSEVRNEMFCQGYSMTVGNNAEGLKSTWVYCASFCSIFRLVLLNHWIMSRKAWFFNLTVDYGWVLGFWMATSREKYPIVVSTKKSREKRNLSGTRTLMEERHRPSFAFFAFPLQLAFYFHCLTSSLLSSFPFVHLNTNAQKPWQLST